MCCTEFIVKYVLFFFNLVFTLAGAALIGLGVAVIYQVNAILDLIPLNLNSLPTLIIVVGCVIFVIAFFGCCGAIRESGCLLILYAVCMIILAALKIWLTVVVFQNLNKLRDLVQDWVTDIFNDLSAREGFNELEKLFSCCGTTGAISYVATGQPIPGTCCGNLVNETCTTTNFYDGCTEILGDYFETYGEAAAAVLIIVIIIELVAMVFSLYMNHTITSKQRATVY